ncbi:MAG: Gfo/Idh/MocA family oxidoreductase [Candidatus Korobacteraceae bacterium]|jgi:predicted dehydrogenase
MKKAGYSDSGQLNVAVVGLGWWGKQIVAELKNNPKLRVAKTVDTVPAAGEWARSQGLEFTNDYNAALADPNIGGVVLCTPHTLHVQQIVAAAKAKKNVFCEKPLTMNRREALTAIGACKENGVALAVGHEHRFKPALQDVLRMVKSGELGTIQMMEGALTFMLRPLPADNWRVQKAESPGGPSMVALGIHALDMCVAVAGAAESVLASASSLISPLPETLGILIKFKSGANAVISSILGPPFIIRFTVFGNKGWVEIHDKAHPQAPEGWVMKKATHDGPAKTIEYPAVSIVRANLEAFADAAAGRAPYPVSHEEMVANISAFEAIGKSAESGSVVKVEG